MNEKKVFFSISQLKIMTAKAILSEAGIPAFSIDKMDSAHALPFGGSIELYVDSSYAQEAKKLLVEAEVI